MAARHGGAAHLPAQQPAPAPGPPPLLRQTLHRLELVLELLPHRLLCAPAERQTPTRQTPTHLPNQSHFNQPRGRQPTRAPTAAANPPARGPPAPRGARHPRRLPAPAAGAARKAPPRGGLHLVFGRIVVLKVEQHNLFVNLIKWMNASAKRRCDGTLPPPSSFRHKPCANTHTGFVSDCCPPKTN